MRNNCWVFVDKDGTEKISNNMPMRRQFKGNRVMAVMWDMCTGAYTKNNWNKWCDGWSTDRSDFLPFNGVIMPKGTIEKLLGKKMKWEDEPININPKN